MKTLLMIVLSLFLILPLYNISAQIIYGNSAYLQGEVIYQSWTFTEQSADSSSKIKLNQSAFPLHIYLPIANDWEVYINSYISRSNTSTENSDNITVSALNNPDATIYHSFSDDRFFTALGILLPTGKTKLTDEEAVLAELVSEDYLNLPVKNFGEGFGWMMQLGGAEQYNDLLFGGSLTYRHTGSYTYLKNGEKYNPGNEFSLQGSASVPFGSEGRFDLDLAFRTYGTDKISGIEIFKNDNQLMLKLGGNYDFSTTSVSLNYLHIFRGANSHQFGNDFRKEDNSSNGDKTVLSGRFTFKLKPTVSASILAGYRHVSANGFDQSSTLFVGKSDLYSIGAVIGVTPTDSKVSFYTRFMLSNGDSYYNHNIFDISGTEVAVGGSIKL